MSEDIQSEHHQTVGPEGDPGAPPLPSPNGEAKQVPMIPTGGEVLIEQVSPLLMAQLRQIDAEHQRLNINSQCLINGYVAAKGWDITTHNVSIDLASGMATVSPTKP